MPAPAARRRRRILVVLFTLNPPGGGSAPAAWMVQALKDLHDVTVLTWDRPDVAAINAYFGTALAPGEFHSLTAPVGWRRLLDPIRFAILMKTAVVFRQAKRRLDEFDLVICGQNEADFGSRSIHYIHYPSRLRPRPATDVRWYHASFVLALYYWLCDRIDSCEPGAVRQAVLVANSAWTASLVERLYRPERPVQVMYPPVAVTTTGRPWAARANGFVCVGRISPEKNIEHVATIVAAVRRRVPDAHLHVVGSRGPRDYLHRVRRLAAANADWLHLHENATRAELLELMGTHRYYLHGMLQEHFGIAPAEAAAAGCIVFVPRDGGQVEIVDHDPRLTYRSVEEAVDNITAVIGDAAEQDRLREVLGRRRDLFTSERFVSHIRAVVDEIAAAGGSGAGA